MPSNFSGYSLASTARPPAATAIPTERRPLRISMAPAPIDPNTTAFFQFCMFTSSHSEPRSAKRLHCSGSSVAPASADRYVEHYEKTAGGRISLARPERFELPAYCSGGNRNQRDQIRFKINYLRAVFRNRKHKATAQPNILTQRVKCGRLNAKCQCHTS